MTNKWAAAFCLARFIITASERIPAADEPVDHLAVLRISAAMLDSFIETKDIDRVVDVRDVILGTTIRGTARIVGKPSVKLAESEDLATFQIVLHGTVNSRTTGYNGPAIIHSRAVTTFTATKQIIFEPGHGFRGLPPKVDARTQTFVDRIDSDRSGLVGRIIRRRAAQIEVKQHAEVNEIARQKGHATNRSCLRKQQ